LKWFKVLTAEMDSKEEEELLNKFGTPGFFIKYRLYQFLASKLNPFKDDWMNFEFDLKKFKQVFEQYGHRGKLFDVLNLLKNQGEIHYRIIDNSKRIEIYSKKFERAAQEYVKRTLRRAEQDEIL